MKNYLIRSLAYHKQARLFFVENTDLIRAICSQPGVRGRRLKTVLGTVVSCASLITGTLKCQQRISLKVQAGQPGLRIFADGDARGNIRGYLSEEWLTVPFDRFERESLASLFGGKGYVQVIKDVGMNHVFTGITDMPYGTIVDDLSHYFAQSEQTATCFANHIEFGRDDEIVASRGILAQLLPGASGELISEIRAVLGHCPTLHATEAPVSELPGRLFGETDIMSTDPIQAFCGCSKAMFYPMLAGLGIQELKEAAAQERTVDMVCHACGCTYSFSPAEIAGLIPPP